MGRVHDADPPAELPPAVRAFDETAVRFDERFGSWLSVAAQRDAVRQLLTKIFPAESRLLELGGGTGEDAVHLAQLGYRVTLTDGSPRMLHMAEAKVRTAGLHDGRVTVEQLVLEDIPGYARAGQVGSYDGAYSNFAALNCVRDLGTLGPPLARLIRPGGGCAFVLFGPCSIGEMVVELARGRPRAAFRRLRRGPAAAKLGRETFMVWYPTPRQVATAMAPYFQLRAVRGIGIAVPPSSAEPWISKFPRVVSSLGAADRLLSAPLALLGDHVLIHLERTSRTVPDA